MKVYETTSFFTVTNIWETEAIRPFLDGKQCKYYIVIFYVHMCGKDDTRQLTSIGDVIEGCHLEQ